LIVITAPTGTIGSQVVDNVLAADQPVRVIVRDPAKLSAHVRENAEVVQGSHGDPDVLAEAFTDADAVFWLVPPAPDAPSVEAAYVGFSRPAAEAIAKYDVDHVVGISALGRGTDLAEHAGLVTGSLHVDDLIAGTGTNYRALVMPSFMENLLNSVRAIKTQGLLTSVISGDRKLPAVASRDIAAIAARLLVARDWSGFEEVPVLGPEDLSFEDMAAVISDVVGEPVRFEQITPQALTSRLTGFGMGVPLAQGMADMMVAKDGGLDNAAEADPAFETPTTFRQWCEDVFKPAYEAA
jgi:uncharacterized protein YbjT (DUF2867 family)